MTAGRRGFTLPEVLIGITLLGVIGAALVRLMVFQARTFEEQQSGREGRDASRGAVNIMLSDLRMVQKDSGGLDTASADGSRIVLRVPVRFGLLCTVNAVDATASFLPVDSGVVAFSRPAGYAWRAASGRYSYVNFVSAADTPSTAAASVCTSAPVNISTITMNGRSGSVMTMRPGTAVATVGAPVFTWQWVTYEFAASNFIPGQRGLWRTIRGAAGTQSEEIAAPFDASARFRYYVGASATSTATPPTDLFLVRGLDLVLNGVSERNPRNRAARAVSEVTTAVFFENTRQ